MFANNPALTDSAPTSARIDLRANAQKKISPLVKNVVESTPVFDIHTHLYAPAFSNLLASGIDELLTYHYLISESFRYLSMPYEKFWQLNKTAQADLIWQELFVQHSPISESCRGVLTTLHKLGLDVSKRDLPALRKWFAAWDPDEYITHCMQIANVQKIGMTNSPFDDAERPTWETYSGDERFVPALRLDPLLVDWENTARFLAGEGYQVSADFSGETLAEVRRFLEDWNKRMKPAYAMVSLPPEFAYPTPESTSQSTFKNPWADCNRLLEGAVLPFCRDHGMAFAMMMGVRRGVNPALEMAGDGVGRSDLDALRTLLLRFPENKFLVTVLSRENQHELCVLARKYRNLHIFGCWWFMNNPLLIEETTQMRLEMLGLSFTPQHSDARVIDQIIYKWDHSRTILAEILTEKYTDLALTGWNPTKSEVERDVQALLGGAFEKFTAR